MAFKSLVLCLSSPLAYYSMMPIAPSHETSCKLQCAVHCNMWYASIQDAQAERSWKPAFPFGCLIFATKKDTDNTEPSKWGCENEAVPAAPAAPFRKHRLSICSTPLLQIWRGTISSFIVFYSACRHSSTHPKKRFCNSALNWVTGVELQDSRILGNYFFALHFQNCDSAWP